jgi:hypothetical protein
MSRTLPGRSHAYAATDSAGVRRGGAALATVVLAALDPARIEVADFLTGLWRGSIWQGQAIRSAGGRMIAEAFLATDVLRSVVRDEQFAWYHQAVDKFCGHRAGTL